MVRGVRQDCILGVLTSLGRFRNLFLEGEIVPPLRSRHLGGINPFALKTASA